jgi:hypothetical protein
MRAIHRSLLLLAGTVFLGTCGDSPTAPTPPEPGTLVVTLQGARPGDGAMIVRVRGPGAIGAVVAASAGYVLHARAAGDSARAALFGPVANGPLFAISVADVHRIAEYRATVVEVSDATNALRDDVSAYALTFARQ